MVNVKVIEGDLPPVGGYKFITFDKLPMKPMLWYARAAKIARVTGKPLDDDAFVITHNHGRYTLWKRERKGQGKMVGVGHKDLKSLARK